MGIKCQRLVLDNTIVNTNTIQYIVDLFRYPNHYYITNEWCESGITNWYVKTVCRDGSCMIPT